MLPDMFYPDAPGWKGAETSKEAAQGVKETAALLRERILEAIRQRPGTPEQIALRLNAPLMNVRPRCSELRKRGLIVDSGGRAQALGGRRAIIWRVRADSDPVEAGR